eukprot:scaffold10131_cov17-Tisochrysis_lutea.AAC.1
MMCGKYRKNVQKSSGLLIHSCTQMHMPNSCHLNTLQPVVFQKPSGLFLNVSNDPILNARHAVVPGIRKCDKLPSDMSR